MSRILVEYLPSITNLSRFLIKDGVTESMISNDGTSNQFQIGYSKDYLNSCLLDSTLKEEIELLKRDIAVLDGLISEGVHYIEL
jgi:hypothetical protein